MRRVEALTLPLMVREIWWRSRHLTGWDGLMAETDGSAIERRRRCDTFTDADGSRMMVFAHSYSAREVFTEAKARGWTTVLGQIDPGEEHFRVVQRVADECQEFGDVPPAPPSAYFEAWREECALADHIVVNSEWTRQSMVRAGIASAKLQMIPLAYEPEDDGLVAAREYPRAFSSARPLRVLFVGHVSIAKGAPALLEAIEQLSDVPIELRVVGARSMIVPPRFLDHPAIRWFGSVPRHEVMRHYRECDVLVFPSHSDGFGMAQIEAQGWRLPIVASPHCGRVVDDGMNGILLAEVSPTAIAGALRRLVGAPELLAEFSTRSAAGREPGLAALSDALLTLKTS